MRKSQGSEDDISLDVQRKKCEQLAQSLEPDNIQRYNLGIHTGFSLHTKPEAEERIDNNDQMQKLLTDLKQGEYGYVVSYDYTRICRDEYIERFRECAIIGGAEFRFVEGEDDLDSLTSGIRREVEKHVKRQEIEKSRQALKQKQEQNEPLGRPPKGLSYSEDKTEYVRGQDFNLVREVVRLREEEDMTYPSIEEKTGVSRSTIYSICNHNRDMYEEFL
jgi:hypothetical protein